MRTSCATARELARISARHAVVVFIRARPSLLDTAQHLSGNLSGLGPRDTVNTNHEQNLWIVGWRHDDDESVTGSALGVSARRSAGLDEGVRVRERAIDLRASSLLRRLRHSGQDFADAGLVPAAN